MASDRLCPSCAAWLCRHDDAWCGFCGAGCAQLALSAQPAILHAGVLAPRLALKVTNASCAELTVDPLQAPAWITFPAARPLSLPPGMTFTFWGDPKTETLARPEAGDIILTTRAGTASVTVLAMEPHPSLRTVPPRLELWSAGTSSRVTVPLAIEPEHGTLKLHCVRPATPAGAIAVTRDVEDGCLAALAHGAPLELAVDLNRLRAEPPPQLLVEYFGPHGLEVCVLPLQILVRNPPQLHWVEKDQPPAECFGGSRHVVQMRLANQQPDGLDGGSKNGDLLIEAVALKPPANHPGLPIRLLTRLPDRISGGESFAVKFELNLEGVISPPTLPTTFRFEVSSNAGTLQRPFALSVRELPVFDGVLAIDFGSSNTCCAVLERGMQYEQLALEETGGVCPTVIRYKSVSGPVPAVEIGTGVKALAAADGRAAAATLRHLKQKLGEAQQNLPLLPDDTDQWITRRASDATADYLHRIRHLAETRKTAVFQEFILTHPAICSLRQHRNLFLALDRAFSSGEARAGLTNVRFLQEPLAALIPFFFTMALRADPAGARAHYTVASFDLGGGTTDIALVRVEHRWLDSSRVEHVAETAKPLEIHTAILSCRGIRFGGEDLTDFLEGRLRENCIELLRALGGSLVLLREDLPGVATADLRRNAAALRNAAEQFKASLSEESARSVPGQIILRVQTIATRETRDFVFDFTVLRSIGRSDLRHEFLAFARQRITRAAALLESAARLHHAPLDFIQLSGMTSFLPVVREVLQQLFPLAEIQRAANPKECVVAGACLLRPMTSRRALRRLILPEGNQRTTSNIGIVDTETGRFQAILPIDLVVPSDGLTRDLAGFWEGEEPVVLWEDLGTDDLSPPTAPSSATDRQLVKLGTWLPERTIELPAAFWTLRLTLKGFDLHVAALGSGRETVAFHPADRSTEP